MQANALSDKLHTIDVALPADAGVLVYTATVTFQEILDARVTSEAPRGPEGVAYLGPNSA